MTHTKVCTVWYSMVLAWYGTIPYHHTHTKCLFVILTPRGRRGKSILGLELHVQNIHICQQYTFGSLSGAYVSSPPDI